MTEEQKQRGTTEEGRAQTKTLPEEVSEIEKAKLMLSHMVHHNEHHLEELNAQAAFLRRQEQTRAAEALDLAAKKLDEAIELMLRAKEAIRTEEE